MNTELIKKYIDKKITDKVNEGKSFNEVIDTLNESADRFEKMMKNNENEDASKVKMKYIKTHYSFTVNRIDDLYKSRLLLLKLNIRDDKKVLPLIKLIEKLSE